MNAYKNVIGALMEIIEKGSMARKLVLGFSLLILIFILYNAYFLYDLKTLSRLTRTIYDHPLVVSNAAMQANVSITKMHRNMKDVVLFKSASRIQQSIAAVNQLERMVYQYLDIVRDKILGDEGKALENESRIQFDIWRSIRNEVIGLVHQGKRDEAAEITIGKGADHVAKLEKKMLALTNYARDKATSFMNLSEKTYQRLWLSSILILILVISTSFLIAFFTWRRIASAENKLRKTNSLLDTTGRMARVGGWELDANTRELSWSEETCRIHEVPLDHKPSLREAIRFFHPEDRKRLEHAFERAFDDGEPFDMEIRFITAKGNHLWTRTICQPELVDGKTAKLLGAFQDITERKRAQEERDRILTFSQDLICIAGMDGYFKYLNPAWEKVLGYTRDELLSKPFLNFIHPDDHLKNDQEFDKLSAGNSVIDFENRYISKDGSIRHIQWMATPYASEGVMYCIGRDITEQKQIKTSLRAIEWLIQSSPKGSYSSYSQFYGDLTILNKERTILDNIGSEMLADIVRGYMELLGTSAAVYERNGDYAYSIFSSGWCRMLNSASRKLCETDDNATALGSGKWLCHESCLESASRVSIQKGEPVDIECNGGIRLYAVPIKTKGEIIGSINFGYGDPPKNMQRIEEIAEKYRADPKALLKEAGKYESRPKFIIEIAKKRLSDSARLIGALVESKISQTELQKERERLNVTLHSIGDGVITTNVDGKVVLLNKVAEVLTGWEQEKAIGRKIEEVFHIVNEHTRKRCGNPVEKVLDTGGIIGLANDTLLLAPDGSERIIADSGAPIVDSDGNTVGVVLVFRDITEKVKLEVELRHAHKMEAIGNLAGGIAHEFNNVLGIIIGNAELAMDDMEKWHPVSENLNEIKLASLRAKDVVKQLLTFSRKMETKREPIDIRVIIKETLKLLRAVIPSSIRIQESLPVEIDHVVADPTQIHQLLINLCNNAAQAMSDEGGKLTIGLNNVSFDYEAASKHPGLQPGAYVRFSVSDTGCGIPSNLLDRIFDPYFTTKDIGKGTGMGLAVVHGIVKSHKGAIDIESRVGEGTAFHVYFPSSKEKAYKGKGESEALPTGNERILFVDDEISIVKLYEKILNELGYSVSSNTDPVRIQKLFKSEPDKYDLIISDMTMPNMTGDQLAIEILNIRPNIPILICTGHSEKMSPEKADKIGIKGLLMKPIMTADLAKAVRKALDEAKTKI